MSVSSQTTREEGTNEGLNRKMLREPWTVPFKAQLQYLQRQEATVANVSLSSQAAPGFLAIPSHRSPRAIPSQRSTLPSSVKLEGTDVM